MTNAPEIFHRQRRRNMRGRGYRRAQGTDFLRKIMAEELMERLSWVTRDFSDCLIVGYPHKILTTALKARGCTYTICDSANVPSIRVQCDEDRLPFADHSFDLIINFCTLDSVNDLPGALILMRRILRPDGLMMASMIGADTLQKLKSVMMEADAEHVSAHIHPQIDVRTMGDLLTRAGFALPVADVEQINIRYAELDKLISDIRDYGGGNILTARPAPLNKTTLQRTKTLFQDRGDEDGRISERLEIIQMSGWAPHPDQPKPATRGSATASMQTVLGKKSQDKN